MKKGWYFLLTACMSLSMLSCGGGDETSESTNSTKEDQKSEIPEKITLEVNPTMKGSLSDYYTVDQAVIKIKKDDYDDYESILSVLISKNDVEPPFDPQNVGLKYLSNWTSYPMSIDISFDLLDDDGIPVLGSFLSGDNMMSELEGLTQLASGETQWINCELTWELEMDEILNIKTVVVNSGLFESEQEEDDSNVEESDEYYESLENRPDISIDAIKVLKDLVNIESSYMTIDEYKGRFDYTDEEWKNIIKELKDEELARTSCCVSGTKKDYIKYTYGKNSDFIYTLQISDQRKPNLSANSLQALKKLANYDQEYLWDHSIDDFRNEFDFSDEEWQAVFKELQINGLVSTPCCATGTKNSMIFPSNGPNSLTFYSDYVDNLKN